MLFSCPSKVIHNFFHNIFCVPSLFLCLQITSLLLRSQICLNIRSPLLKKERGVGRSTDGIYWLLSQFQGPPVKNSTPGKRVSKHINLSFHIIILRWHEMVIVITVPRLDASGLLSTLTLANPVALLATPFMR